VVAAFVFATSLLGVTPMRIPNVDTLSALLDRLIVEHIKRFFFAKDGLRDKVHHQDEVLDSIRRRISELLQECICTGQYEFLAEYRTFPGDALVEELEDLIFHNIQIGEADRAKLVELRSSDPRSDTLVLSELLARTALEARARSKIKIDEIFKALLDSQLPHGGDDAL